MPNTNPFDRLETDSMATWMLACNPALVWLSFAQSMLDGWIAGTDADDPHCISGKIVPFPTPIAGLRRIEKRTVILCV